VARRNPYGRAVATIRESVRGQPGYFGGRWGRIAGETPQIPDPIRSDSQRSIVLRPPDRGEARRTGPGRRGSPYFNQSLIIADYCVPTRRHARNERMLQSGGRRRHAICSKPLCGLPSCRTGRLNWTMTCRLRQEHGELGGNAPLPGKPARRKQIFCCNSVPVCKTTAIKYANSNFGIFPCFQVVQYSSGGTSRSCRGPC
jgi:hypothetical protein